ncbi:MAG TPA: FAD-dependent oxidoreductase [Patescibacteria group bacterium]|nr:FAD-dependent oxidoreductase [Patescibacteria group bacterium]
MVHKNTSFIISVKTTRAETPGYLSVIFERPRNFKYEAGDWMDLELTSADLRGGKTYSFSSSPTDQDLMITFREGISPFKKALAALKAGDELRVVQYGNDYGFRLSDNRSSILIAGGVGIAPFRSMIKEMADRHDKNTVHLIYLHQTGVFIFQQELDEWSKILPNLKITYIVTKDLKRKDRERTLSNIISSHDQRFYIAGPEGMVADTQAFLIGTGVDKRNIKVDSFGGY